MKQRIFSTLLFSVLLLFALNLKGDIDYTSNPVVGVNNSSFTRVVDVVTGKVSWWGNFGNTVNVYVSAGMKGVGEGQGTLTNISIPGILKDGPIGTWQDGVDKAGTTNPNGSWSSGTSTADALYPVSLPKDGDSWTWSAGGYTEIWPKEWHESVTVGGRVHIPSGVSGSYSKTGSWKDGTKIKRSAQSRSGKITVEVVYDCSKCGEYSNTKAAVCGSGQGVTCPSKSCGCKGAPTSYGCSKVASRNWCNDGGTCTVGSGSGVPSPQCGENYCCCAGYSTPPSSGSTPPSSGSTPPSSGSTPPSSGGGSTPPSGGGSTPPSSGGGSTPPTGSGSTPPTDNTPNCPDCTSDCSSPCSCTNSGTCGGTVSTPPSGSEYGCARAPGLILCDNKGSCTVGSTSGNPGPQCGEEWCCCPYYE